MDPANEPAKPTSPISHLRGAKVLVATDLSPASDEALVEGDRWARALGGTLAVLHVVPYPIRTSMLFPQNVAADLARLMDLEARIGNALAARVSAKTRRPADEVAIRVDSGAVPAAILRQAQELGAGLIVVGSHGSEGFGRRVLGTVAERVVRQAHCAVLVARWQAAQGHILAATDFSGPSLTAVDVAADLAGLSGAGLTVLHATPRDDMAIAGRMWSSEVPWPAPPAMSDRAMEEAAKANLASLATSHRITASLRVMIGSPAAAIVQAAEDLPAELVVVGTRGLTGLPRLLLGSVAETVVRAAPCSVLAVREVETATAG